MLGRIALAPSLAILGLHPALRVRSSQLAATIAAVLLLVAGVVAALPQVLARA